MSTYTESDCAKIKALVVDGAPITFAVAEAFAVAEGRKVRSVVGKIKSMKLPYEPKPVKVTKTGAQVVAKATMVKAIEVALNVAAPSLEKATKEDLERVLGGLAALSREQDAALEA